MYIIIAGGGVVGSTLVKKLIERKYEMVVIEADKEICDDLFAAYGVETINGNATRLSVLKAAGIEKADVMVGTMRNDAANLAYSVLARSFSVPEIIVRMNNSGYLEAYKTAGVTKVISVVDSMIEDIVYQIEKPDIQQVARLGDGAVEIFIVRVPENGKVVGKTISDIAADRRMHQESIIAGVFDVNEKEFKVPRGNTKIPANSDLFVITRPDLVKKTAKYLMQT